MKIKDVYILKEAVADLEEGRAFYDAQEQGVGNYFWDCLIADINSLTLYAGTHRKKFGLHQMLAKRFPYAIYYDVVEDIAYVAAVLPMRRNPAWIVRQLKRR